MTLSIRKQLGFTLVELVIVIVLIGIVGTISAFMMSQTVPGSLVASDQGESAWQARTALARMEREIREANPNSIAANTVTQFGFVDATGSVIYYTLVGNQLFRNFQPLVDNVTGFALLYYDATGTQTAVAANIRYVLVGIIVTENDITTPVYLTSIAIRNVD